MAKSQGRAKETFQELKGRAEEIGLQVNTNKTKLRLVARSNHWVIYTITFKTVAFTTMTVVLK